MVSLSWAVPVNSRASLQSFVKRLFRRVATPSGRRIPVVVNVSDTCLRNSLQIGGLCRTCRGGRGRDMSAVLFFRDSIRLDPVHDHVRRARRTCPFSFTTFPRMRITN